MKRVPLKTTKCNRFIFFTSLLLIVYLSIFISSCSKDDDQAPAVIPPVVITEISEEIKDLIYFKGDEKAPTVLINAQSGPDTAISISEVNLIVEEFDTTDLLVVNVHQEQTLNPDIIKDNDITLDQAVGFNTESIETLNQVVKFFKDQGRTVYVLGESFGAFVTQELIAKKGIDVADKYLIMTGRLDMNDIMWQGMAEGRFGYFENGITPVLSPDPEADAMNRNIGRIAAGLGMNKYTQEFSAMEDLSDVTYIYGDTDQAVGRLTAEEVDFLESKNANVIKGNGGHDDIFENFRAHGFKVAFGIE